MKLKKYSKYKDSGVDWIGEIPEDWKIRKIKNIGKISTSSVDKKSDPSEKAIKLLNYMDIYNSKEITNDIDFMKVTIKPSQYVNSNLKVGDLLFTPSSETVDDIGHSAVIMKELKGVVYSYHILRLRFNNNENINLDYKRYIFNNYYFLNQLSSKATGTTRMTLGLHDFKDSSLVLPPIQTQQKISSFLDLKTSKIEKLIEKDKRIIDLLKEKRVSLINKVITKGLDNSVRMKDSGVEWIGEIPESWEAVPLLKKLESLVDYRGKTPEKVDEGIFLITAKNIKNGIIDYELSKEYVNKEALREIMRRGKPEIGDLLFTTEAPLGEVANIDNTNIALAQRVMKMRGKKGILDNYFLKNIISSKIFQGFLYSLATGSTALGIKSSNLCYIKILFPPFDEQQKIVSYINNQTKKIDNHVKKVEERIGLYKEYKKSLIYNVVTGKVEV